MGDMDEFINFLIELVSPSEVIKIIEDAKKFRRYYCPNCNSALERGKPCPECRTPLRWFLLE